MLVHPLSTRTTLASVLACGDVVDRTYLHQYRPGRLRGLPLHSASGLADSANGTKLLPDMYGGPNGYFAAWRGPRSITMSAKTPIQAAAKPGRRTTGQAGVRCQRCGPAGNRQLLKPPGSADSKRTCWQAPGDDCGPLPDQDSSCGCLCRVRPSRVAFPASRGLAPCSVLSAGRRTGHPVVSMLTIGIPSRDQRPCRMDTPRVSCGMSGGLPG